MTKKKKVLQEIANDDWFDTPHNEAEELYSNPLDDMPVATDKSKENLCET
tara:strand:+ start:555 stop:704 length:150 start_codon:yes stop_codon:yes gene_type:complete